jgi:hypothetical protein
LVHAGAVGKAVADHHLSGLKRGLDRAFQMVAAGGGEEQDLGLG